jgi:RNA polymerase-binding protein DksA
MIHELDLQQVRQALEYERQQLFHSLMEQESFLPMLENPDESDLADLYESQELRSSLDELSLRKLDRVVYALERISDGTYGVCLKCKTAIPVERLLALPYAELCVACQAKLEGI